MTLDQMIQELEKLKSGGVSGSSKLYVVDEVGSLVEAKHYHIIEGPANRLVDKYLDKDTVVILGGV